MATKSVSINRACKIRGYKTGKTRRVGWVKAFAGMAADKDDLLVHDNELSRTKFEAKEWRW